MKREPKGGSKISWSTLQTLSSAEAHRKYLKRSKIRIILLLAGSFLGIVIVGYFLFWILSWIYIFVDMF